MATFIENENESVKEELMAKSHNACQICVKCASNYTCPRCNIRYCSVNCYRSQKHVACSEGFYRECVINGLKGHTTRPEDRQKVLEMLQRLEEDVPTLDSDEDDVEDLQERIGDLDLDHDSDEIWRRLTDGERSEFKDMLRDGRLGNLVETWTPWWSHKDTRLVRDDETSDPRGMLSHVPSEITDLPDIHQLLRNQRPSSDTRNNVINVLYSYAYIVRLYNGGHWDNVGDVVEELLEVSDVLSSNATYSSPSNAVHACIHRITQMLGKDSNRPFNISVIQDVCNLIEGAGVGHALTYTLAALSDLHRLMASVIQDLKKKRTKGDNRDTLRRTFCAHKKLEFLLSWCRRYGMALHSAVAELQLDICSMTSDLAAVEGTKGQLENAWKKAAENENDPVLIEEIS